MKSILLILTAVVSLVLKLEAQTLEHFKIEGNERIMTLVPTFDEHLPGVNGEWHDNKGYVKDLLKKEVRKLPDTLKQEIARQKVIISFCFNKKGEIYYGRIMVVKNEDFSLTDSQWMKVYNTIRKIKIDMTKLEIKSDFEWGNFMYNLSTLLL